jgi:hypothetical protein
VLDGSVEPSRETEMKKAALATRPFNYLPGPEAE